MRKPRTLTFFVTDLKGNVLTDAHTLPEHNANCKTGRAVNTKALKN